MLLHTFQKNFPFAVTNYIIVEMRWGNQAESGGFTGFSFDLFRGFTPAFSDIFRYENPARIKRSIPANTHRYGSFLFKTYLKIAFCKIWHKAGLTDC